MKLLPLLVPTVLSAIACGADPGDGTEVEASVSSSCPERAIVGVAASGEQATNPASNSIDGDLATRWSNDGPSTITYDLGQTFGICSVEIAWYKGTTRKNSFRILTSGTSSGFAQVFSGASSGTTSSFESYALASSNARFVRIEVTGNTATSWTSVLEVRIRGTTPTTNDPLAGAVFTPIRSADQTINGNVYSVHSAFLDHSIQRSQNGGIYRFELHQGERRASDSTGSDRTELRHRTTFATNTELWAAYSFMVAPGAALAGEESNVFGQWHAGLSSPPLAFRLPFDTVLRIKSLSGTAGDSDSYYPYIKSDFVRGRWYHVVQHVKFDNDGRGLIQIWIDGVEVANDANISTTYDESTGNYWKFGIYRKTMAQVEVAYYANMEVGTASKLTRVTTPLPIQP